MARGLLVQQYCGFGAPGVGLLHTQMTNLKNRCTAMRSRIALTSTLALGLLLGTGGIASTTGQPNQSCEDHTTRPGNAASAPGSAFNPNGTAGTKYAGEQPQNSNNPNSVSQYDVACTQVSSH